MALVVDRITHQEWLGSKGCQQVAAIKPQWEAPDKVLFGIIVNRALTIKSGQTHVQRYLKPLLALIEQLTPLGTVVVTDYKEGYQVLNYLRRYTPAPIRVVLWISMFLQLLEERLYSSQPGAILESFGRLLFTDVTIYVAPMRKEALLAALGSLPEGLLQEPSDRDLLSLDDLLPKSPLDHLFGYLRASGRIVPLNDQRSKT